MRRFSDNPEEDRRIRRALNSPADSSVKLKALETADLPDAADHRHGLVFDETTGAPKFSNGSDWLSLVAPGTVPSLNGIKFPATQVPSADANTLDDYEEGTFTPGLVFGGGSTGMTFASRSGNYTKIGRVVHLQIAITLSAKGSSTGSAVITGLPFTSGEQTYGTIVASNVSSVGYPTVDSSGVLGNFSSSALSSLSDANFANNTNIWVNLTYRV